MAYKEQSILRGERYYSRRNRDTNEMPDWEKSQPAIMADVEAYLNSKESTIKPEEIETKSKGKK